MALAVPLLIVAGLLIRSVDRLEGQDVAVNRGHVLLVDFGPSLSAIPERTATAVRRDLLDRVREQPDVADATFASQTPLGGGVHGSSLRVEGRPLREDRDAVAAFVGPGYFHTVGIPLVTGRDFSAQDDAAHPPVVVLSETAARVFGADMLGHRVAYGTRPFAEVIGIAKDVKFTSLREAAPRQVYLAQLQNGALGGRLVVRTDGDPLAITASLRDTIRRAAPNLPITKMTTLDEEIRAKTAAERALAMTATGLASATLLVSAIGLCGLTAYMVARRTREFGIRMALGESQGQVMRAVVARALRLVGAGSIVGAIAAVATTRVVASLLYDVSPADWIVLAASSAALLVAALAASLVPAAQASRVDPVSALRTE
jgi:predicted permease